MIGTLAAIVVVHYAGAAIRIDGGMAGLSERPIAVGAPAASLSLLAPS